MNTQCPCCSGKDYDGCCGVFIDGSQHPATPEQLMRSRYTAYTQANVDYIALTMKEPAANDFNAEESKAWASTVTWLKLDVLSSRSSGDQGFVEFIAHFDQNGQHHHLHELSEFQRENSQWFYVDGAAPDTVSHTPVTTDKTGRNDPCPCGSGKKYKKCCGA